MGSRVWVEERKLCLLVSLRAVNSRLVVQIKMMLRSVMVSSIRRGRESEKSTQLLNGLMMKLLEGGMARSEVEARSEVGARGMRKDVGAMRRVDSVA